MPFPPRPLHLAALLIAAASVTLLLALGSSASALGTCTDNFTGADGGDWGTAGNWDNGVPTSSSVACWSGKTVVISTGTQQAGSIQGGTLSITGGSLQLTSTTDDSQLDGLTITNGNLGGPSGRTLTVAGDFDWNVSSASGINGSSGGLAIAQSGSHNFTIEGNGQAYLQGGSLSTPNAVSIDARDFIATNSPTLTTTSTVTLASGSYQPNGGGPSVTITAAGVVTSGDTAIPDYTLHLTGSSSSLSGTLTVPALSIDAGKTLTVPSGDGVSVGSGTISGTVTGAGTWTQTGSTTHIASGGELSTDHVAETAGQLTLDSGGTYSAATSTSVSGGTLTLDDDASTGSFTMTAGDLTGPSGKTLTVTGDFDWNVGFASGINSGSGALAIAQSGTGKSFTIEGSGQAYLQGGSLSSANPVSISATDFIATGTPTPTLTTTSTVTFAPGSYQPNGGGASVTISAAGVVTTGDTSIPDYALHVTGSSTSLSGTLTVPALSTDAGTTTTVPSGAELKVGNGTIAGTVGGAGTYTQSSGTTTIASGGELSTDHVGVPTGQLTQSSGGSYRAAASTSISGGTLTLHDDASTGALTITAGNLTGSTGKTLTVAGDFDWNVGFASGINSGSGGLAIHQTGTHSFTIEGSGQAYLQGGSLSTANPVSISDLDFINTGSPSLTTTSAVTFAPGSYSVNGGASLTLSAAGFVTSGDTTLPNYALHLTGGTMSVPSGRTLAPGAMTVEGGTLQVDGTLQSATSLSGGTLKGAGTIGGALTNSGGTVAPGDSPGTLSVTGNYTQGSGGTLAIPVNGTSAGQFSVLAVGGNANLDGTLALEPSAGYGGSAAAGDRVAFLTYGPSRSGTFATTTVTPPLASGAPMTADYSNAHEVDAVVGNAPPPGNTTQPAISGGAVQGQTLTASHGAWSNGPTSYTYQWQRCDASGANCRDIPGATGSTYTPGPDDVGHTIRVVVTAANAGGSTQAASAATPMITAPPPPPPPSTAPAAPAAPAPLPLPLRCSGRPIVLLDVHRSGNKVLVSGLALPKFAGQTVTITPSQRKARAGRAKVNADGTFDAALGAPKGRHTAGVRYQATVAGQRSLSLKLTRQLVITGERPSASGLRVSMRLLQGRKGQMVTITRQESCTKSVLFKKVKAGSGGRFSVTLPTPSGSGALAFYRASAALRRHGKTYSLPVTVRAAG